MESEENIIQCSNCRQNIQESKKILHEAFCLRNNKFCGECEKVVLASEFEEHIKCHNSAYGKALKQISETKKTNPTPETVPEKKTVVQPKIKAVIRKVQVDDSLGIKKCEYCCNLVDNLEEHLEECEVKKMIEKESQKYFKDLKEREKKEKNLIDKLSKEKYMDVSNDEQMAKNLQKNWKPLMNTDNDEKMAKDLQKKWKPIMDTDNDEKMAKQLQEQFKADTSNDEEMARKLQQEFGSPIVNTSNDEEMARRIGEEEKQNLRNFGGH